MRALSLRDVGYTSFNDVLTEVKGLFTTNLVEFTMGLPEAYNRMLKAPPDGVYALGSMEPLLNFTQQPYYTEKAYRSGRGPDIYNYTDFLKVNGRIFDAQGQVVAHTTPGRSQQMYQPYATVNWAAIHCAFIEVWDFFLKTQRHVAPINQSEPEYLNLENYVKEEYLLRPGYRETTPIQLSPMMPVLFQSNLYQEDSKYSAIGNPQLGQLLDTLYEFVRPDICSVYRLTLQNTLLVVEKGNDIRIIEYHRLMEQHLDDLYLQRAHQTASALPRP